jgi:hypothetical protein
MKRIHTDPGPLANGAFTDLIQAVESIPEKAAFGQADMPPRNTTRRRSSDKVDFGLTMPSVTPPVDRKDSKNVISKNESKEHEKVQKSGALQIPSNRYSQHSKGPVFRMSL